MIDFINVSKSYRTASSDKVILEDVTLSLPTDESIGILGKNGTGKSTLMRLLSGVEKPDEGEIYRDVRISPPIGFGGLLHGKLTAAENARFIANFYGYDPDYVMSYAYEFADIGDYFFMPTETYSSGMRARAAFAATLAIEFDVYLVDEIMAVGDLNFRNKRKRFLRGCSNNEPITKPH